MLFALLKGVLEIAFRDLLGRWQLADFECLSVHSFHLAASR